MNTLNLDNIGGLPFDQQVLQFMQDDYSKPLGAIAKLCGDRTILYGVEVINSNVDAGYIAYNGELLPFIGGSVAAEVLIQEEVIAYIFEDNNSYPVETRRRAVLVNAGGTFPFADLQSLTTLQHIWKKDDLRMCKKDNAYIAANFDATTGVGITELERGWQIFTMQDVSAAGKTFVNIDVNDTDFDEAGKVFGSKSEELSKTHIPPHEHSFPTGGDGAIDNNVNGKPLGRQNDDNRQGTYKTSNGAEYGLGNGAPNTTVAAAHNNMQPSYAILTLIKL